MHALNLFATCVTLCADALSVFHTTWHRVPMLDAPRQHWLRASQCQLPAPRQAHQLQCPAAGRHRLLHTRLLHVLFLPSLFGRRDCAGAMRIQRGFTNITNSSLTSNRAHRNGGGVYLGTLTGSNHTTGLNETTQCYDPSRSQNKGLDAGRVALLVDRSTFDNNTAESNGGESGSGCSQADVGTAC